ncbi:hypothetical protein P43SY_005991 [Pythium insidiosum]|uniref:Uncharacterized protein n=1 Tax=Pythium insidiosum TaxID=114742 RepID=A0AAD5LCA7_PYTIN|nr:hypothetical protein P43SY_005991 [Pythium insidiosum]
MAVDRVNSYITLTPRSNDTAPPSSATLAKDVLTRKWEAAKKKDAKDSHLGGSRSGKESAHDNKASPTETDKSSEVDLETDIPETSDAEDVDDDNAFGVLPTYVCELHDPKAVLKAEHVYSKRVEISLISAPRAISKDNKDKRYWGWHSNNTFRYEIAVGLARTVFDCTPPKVLEVLKTLYGDKKVSDELRFIETNYFRDGFLGSIKRLYPSAHKLSEEIVEVLESISDIDAVLLHNAYLGLIGVTKGTLFYREIENFIRSHNHPVVVNQPDDQVKCMCEAYKLSVDRFGDYYKQHQDNADSGRFSVVASESLMWTRGVLSFYTDTVYLMDKREFLPWRGLNQCTIYGFGRRKLFEIVRTSRKEWAFRHCVFGTLATLSLERYMHHINPYHMVSIKRRIPDSSSDGGVREENVCFVKKSKTKGYRCLLMSEMISRGRVTTSLSIEEAASPPGDPHYHYVTMSEISGAARESVCSSTLSVPVCHYKHVQQLHLCGGSDVVAYLALAASYDILVGALSYWREKRY